MDIRSTIESIFYSLYQLLFFVVILLNVNERRGSVEVKVTQGERGERDRKGCKEGWVEGITFTFSSHGLTSRMNKRTESKTFRSHIIRFSLPSNEYAFLFISLNDSFTTVTDKQTAPKHKLLRVDQILGLSPVTSTWQTIRNGFNEFE